MTKTTNDTPLKNCPACGKHGTIFWDYDEETAITWHRGRCVDMCLSTSNFTTADEAVAAWNKRADGERIEKLRTGCRPQLR